MSIQELKNKNQLAEFHTDWLEKKSRFEKAKSDLEVVSIVLKGHDDFQSEATVDEKKEITDFDIELAKIKKKDKDK